MLSGGKKWCIQIESNVVIRVRSFVVIAVIIVIITIIRVIIPVEVMARECTVCVEATRWLGRLVQVFHEHIVRLADPLELCSSLGVIWILVRMGAQSKLDGLNEAA